jgi:hypothetical protein
MSESPVDNRVTWRTSASLPTATLASLLRNRNTALRAHAVSLQEWESEGGTSQAQYSGIRPDDAALCADRSASNQMRCGRVCPLAHTHVRS